VVIVALVLAIGLILTIVVARAASCLDDREVDWIFQCPGQYGQVLVYEGFSGFVVDKIEPPFQLGWTEDGQPALTVKDGKCELIYPLDLS
jgi:hypothetical protein